MTMKIYGDEECTFHLYFYEDLLTFISAEKNFNFHRCLSRRRTSGDSHIKNYIYILRFIGLDDVTSVFVSK